MQHVIDWLRNAWKAVIALAVPILWAAGIELFDALQGTFVDNPIALAVVAAALVWLKRNRPLPE